MLEPNRPPCRCEGSVRADCNCCGMTDALFPDESNLPRAFSSLPNWPFPHTAPYPRTHQSYTVESVPSLHGRERPIDLRKITLRTQR